MAEAGGTATISAKRAQRYDRQLRLWGDHGQQALSDAKVCCINGGSVGSEIMKNLVLPGIGSFTIVDKHKITQADLGNNFFVTSDAVGQSRAEVVTELLREMNEEVLGTAVEDDPINILQSNPGFFSEFTVVVATQLEEKSLLQLAAVLWEAKIPLLVARAYGFIGYIRVVVHAHDVVESHPEDMASDLRLVQPFPELVEFCSTVNLQELSLEKHKHMPFAVILYKLLEEWKASHDGQHPVAYADKKAFKKTITAAVRIKETTEDGSEIQEDEENFEEATKAANTALLAPGVPMEIRQLVEAVDPLGPRSSNFSIMLKALGDFVKANDVLPVRGDIPDMVADSDIYIALQNLYVNKARDDCAAISASVKESLSALGRPEDAISEFELKTFCKNAGFLHIISTRSLAEEYASITDFNPFDEYNPDNVWYVLLRAADQFFAAQGAFPGASLTHQPEDDVPKVKEYVSGILDAWGLPNSVDDRHISELCRAGGAELHTIAAYLGGACAQEVIKLVTHQYIPVNGTYLYNSITGKAVTLSI